MKPLEIREAKSGELSISGLSFVEVVSMKEVINYLAEGIKVSSILIFLEQSHQLNTSQHKVFQITLNFSRQIRKIGHQLRNRIALSPRGECTFCITQLRIVDLAGS